MKARSISIREHFSIILRIAIWNMRFKRLAYQVHSFKSPAGKKTEAILRKIALSRFFGRLILLFLPSLNYRPMEYPIAIANLGSERRNKIILDIGSALSCFPGFLAHCGYTVICLDVQKDLLIENNLIIKKLKERLLGEILFVIADAQNLPFKDGSISRVTSISTFQFVLNDIRASSEVGRILTRDGICIISVTYSPKTKSSKKFGDGTIQRFYTNEEILSRIINPSGLKLDSSYLLGNEILPSIHSALPIPLRVTLVKNPFVNIGMYFLEHFCKSQSETAKGIMLKLSAHLKRD